MPKSTMIEIEIILKINSNFSLYLSFIGIHFSLLCFILNFNEQVIIIEFIKLGKKSEMTLLIQLHTQLRNNWLNSK